MWSPLGRTRLPESFSHTCAASRSRNTAHLFMEEVEEARNKKAKSGSKQIDPKTLIDASVRAQYPGKDGDVKLFNKDGKAFSFRWDGHVGAWVEIGEVTGFAGEVVDGVRT